MEHPEEDPAVMKLFIDYLYLSYIPLPVPPAKEKVEEVIAAKKQHLANLVSLCCFAEKILHEPLMNKPIDSAQSLCYKEQFSVTLESLCDAYEHTPHSSKLRLFTCELYIYIQKFSATSDGEGYMTPGAIKDLVRFVKHEEDLLVDLFAMNGNPSLDDPREKQFEKPCYFHKV